MYSYVVRGPLRAVYRHEIFDELRRRYVTDDEFKNKNKRHLIIAIIENGTIDRMIETISRVCV